MTEGGEGGREEREEWSQLTGSLAFGSPPLSRSLSTRRSSPSLHTAHRMGKPEPSWADGQGIKTVLGTETALHASP